MKRPARATRHDSVPDGPGTPSALDPSFYTVHAIAVANNWRAHFKGLCKEKILERSIRTDKGPSFCSGLGDLLVIYVLLEIDRFLGGMGILSRIFALFDSDQLTRLALGSVGAELPSPELLAEELVHFFK